MARNRNKNKVASITNSQRAEGFSILSEIFVLCSVHLLSVNAPECRQLFQAFRFQSFFSLPIEKNRQFDFLKKKVEDNVREGSGCGRGKNKKKRKTEFIVQREVVAAYFFFLYTTTLLN